MSLAAGFRLGSYGIGALLGAGGMGEAHRARDLMLKRKVAIKVRPAYCEHEPDRLPVIRILTPSRIPERASL
jgi:hypothetical protein